MTLGAQSSLFDNITVTEDGELRCACPNFEHEAACKVDGRKKDLPSPYSMRFPHKQCRRSSAIRRLYDRYKIDEAKAIELLRPISKSRDGCWAIPFDPAAVVSTWQPMRPVPRNI